MDKKTNKVDGNAWRINEDSNNKKDKTKHTDNKGDNGKAFDINDSSAKKD